MVDTNLLVSDIEALRARLRALNKPLLAILVTHPHPDHFNGVFGLVQDKKVPVYAAASVARVIEEIAEAKREQWSPTYGAEWPATTYYPDSPLADGARVRFGELTFTVRELGPAESQADSYFLVAADGYAPVAFTGDLAFHGTPPTPPMVIRPGGWRRLTGWPASSSASARFTPVTATRPGRMCSPSSVATSFTTGNSSGACPVAMPRCRRLPGPSSTRPCRPSCPVPRSPG